MTGFDVGELIDASFDEGAICVIHKPFDPKQIVDVIRSSYKFCLARLPRDIGALVSEIQQEIDGVIKGSPIARVTVRIPDGELRALRLLAASGPAAEHTQTLCSSASLGGIAFYGNEEQITNDYQSHPLKSEPSIGLGFRSVLAVPIGTASGRTWRTVHPHLARPCRREKHLRRDRTGYERAQQRSDGDVGDPLGRLCGGPG